MRGLGSALGLLSLGVPLDPRPARDLSLTPVKPLDLSFYHRTDSLLDSIARLSQPSNCAKRMYVENIHDRDDAEFRMRLATFQDEASSSAGAKQP